MQFLVEAWYWVTLWVFASVFANDKLHVAGFEAGYGKFAPNF